MRRIAELFEQALDVPVDERDAWLAKVCGSDAALRLELEGLLRADARAARFMERPPALVAAAAPDRDDRTPKQFGPYRVLRRIGVGGMGEVWLGERSDGEFEQRVAIKQVAYPTPGLLQRFRQERQILARLEHPNIARLIDGGVSADGAPYLVMEYVEGVPITEFAREQALDVPSRLRLFLRVCEAVQYAHQNLIVHRDLKPSNIFVTSERMPKLLDFGIAKVLTTTDIDAPTQTIARLLTPDYAAPEQFTGAPVTTATDVYALGVVLYEMLAGARPQRVDRNGGATPTHALDPPAPSSVVDRTTGADPVRRGSLRGDLDRIALTALAADPARRYQSAEALAADIRSHLDGRPIAARGDRTWYRLTKFARRNRYALGAAVLVFAVCIAATVISLQQARLARAEAQRAEAVRTFLVGVFAQASPDESKGKPITAHELLDKSEKQIDKDLQGQPALNADITTLLATLYMDVGDYGQAETLLKRTAAADETLVPPEIRARTLTVLANLQNDKRETDAAFENASNALALARSAGKAGADEASAAQHSMNTIMVSRGDSKAAEPQLRATLAEDLAAFGEQHAAVAEDWSLLGTALDEMTRYDESAAAFNKSIAISRALHGSQHNTVSRGLNDLGLMLLHKGDLVGAETALRESVDIAVQLYGRDTDNSWTARSNYIRVLELQGRYREALAQRQEIFEAEQRLVSETRPDSLAFASNFIGVDHRELGELDEADKAFRRALALWVKIQGSNEQPQSATPLANLGINLTLQGRYDEASQTLQSAYAIEKKHQAPSSQWVNLTRGTIGNLLRLQHRYAEGVKELREATAALKPSTATPNSWLALLGAQLAEAELDAGDATKARTVASEAVATARKALPEGNPRLGAPLFALARAELALENAAAAEALAREALASRSRILPPHDPRVLEVQVLLINALAAQQRKGEAESLRAEIEQPLKKLASPYGDDLRERLASR
jgi:serine/threonine-protein kinase